MRGHVLAFCIAASLLAIGGARADETSGAAPVSLNLVPQASAPRSAENYLAGTTFVATGPSGFLSETVESLPILAVTQPYGPPGPRQPDLRNVMARFSLTPELSFDLGYQLDDAARFATVAPSTNGYDGLFFSGPQLSPTPYGTSSYAGATVKLSDDVRLHLGDAVATHDRNAVNGNAFATFGRPVDALLDLGARTANSLFGGVSLDGGWASIDLTATRTVAKQELLTDAVIPTLSTTLDVTANVKFNGGWVTTASYGEGLTKLDVKPSALALSSAGELHRTGYALAVAKHGVFGDDALGLSVSRPADPEGGYATFGGHLSQPAFIGADHLLMIDQKPETDIEVGYVTNFLDGAVALQTNAAYDMNFQGQNGTNAVQLLSRAKIKF